MKLNVKEKNYKANKSVGEYFFIFGWEKIKIFKNVKKKVIYTS